MISLRTLGLALLCLRPALGAYGYCAPVVFPGASGSDQSDITLVFSFSDAKMATVANGGVIEHLVSRNGENVPADAILTTDATGGSIAGVNGWGYDGDYSESAGTGHAWVRAASYPTSGLTLYLCAGNAGVTTYQGGAQGSEYDSYTAAAYHFPDGSALSAVDSVTGTAGTVTGPVAAAAGKVDGAGQFGGHSNDAIATDLTSNSSQRTYSIWTYRTGTGGGGFGRAFDRNGADLLTYDTVPTTVYTYNRAFSTTAGAWYIALPSSGAWHKIDIVYDSSSTANAPVIYVDGSSATVTTRTAPVGTATAPSAAYSIGNRLSDYARSWTGSLDEFRISDTLRPADWIATEYANQSSPPALGAFAPVIATSAPRLLTLGVG